MKAVVQTGYGSADVVCSTGNVEMVRPIGADHVIDSIVNIAGPVLTRYAHPARTLCVVCILTLMLQGAGRGYARDA